MNGNHGGANAGAIARPAASAPSRRLRALGRHGLTYLSISPALITFAVLLGYPVFLVIEISLRKLNLAQLISGEVIWNNPLVKNYQEIFASPKFIDIVIRTFLFTAVNVGLTIVLGMLVALLLQRLSRWVRLLLSGAMILAWAMPALTGSVVFQWLFDSKFGVVNWAISSLGVFGDWTNHSWFETGPSTFSIIVLLIVWQSIPFVAFSLYAAMLAIPKEQYEAARVDGGTERQIFRHITFPSVRPMLMILTFLSIIWDFKVFTQVWTMRQGGPDGQTVTLSVYAYITGISGSRFGVAAAVSVFMVAVLLLVLVPYIYKLLKAQDEL